MKITFSLILLVVSAVAGAQPAFDAASIKPSLPPGQRVRWVGIQGGPGSSDPGRIDGRNMSLQGYVETAYSLSYYQVSGPDWTANDCFDIAATMAPGTTKAEYLQMLQKLLADRFHLVVHRETKQLPVYRLVVAKGGSRMQPPASDPAETPGTDKDSGGKLTRDKDGYPLLAGGMTMAIMPGPDGKPRARTQGHKKRMDAVVGLLSGQLATPVIDATGLTGEYDYALSWIPARPGTGPSEEVSDVGPDLFQAIQQQLGLKLEGAKGPVEVMVIDSASKTPVEN